MAENSILTPSLGRSNSKMSFSKNLPRAVRKSAATLLLLAALAVEVYFLVRGKPLGLLSKWTGGSSWMEGEPIASVVSKVQDVRVQPVGDLVWDAVEPAQTLYKKQNLLTLARSKVLIEFADGSGLELQENTLVEIDRPAESGGFGKPKRLSMKLLRGSLRKVRTRKEPGAAAPTDYEIQLGDSKIEFGSRTSLNLQAEDAASGRGAQVVVEEGDARTDHAGESLSLRAGEEGAFPLQGEKGSVVTRRNQFAPVLPSGGALLESEAEKTQVKFKWNINTPPMGEDPQELEISADPAFKSQVNRLRIAGTHPPLQYVETQVTLPTGSEPKPWYWRVKGLGPAEGVSRTEKFWLQPKARPALLLPGEGSKLPPKEVTRFVWKEATEASEYDLELKGAVARVERVRQASYELAADDAQPGQVQWRVRIRYADGAASAWSDWRSLTLSGAPAGPPPPADLEADVTPQGESR